MYRNKTMIVVLSLACVFLFSGSEERYTTSGMLELLNQKIHGLYLKADEQHAIQMAEIAILRKEIEVEREVNRNLRKVALLQMRHDLEAVRNRIDLELVIEEPVK